MAGTSERIIILSALLLVVIIGAYVGTPRQPPIVSLNDIRIELETDKEEYINEVIEVEVCFYNDRPDAVRINTNIDKAIMAIR